MDFPRPIGKTGADSALFLPPFGLIDPPLREALHYCQARSPALTRARAPRVPFAFTNGARPWIHPHFDKLTRQLHRPSMVTGAGPMSPASTSSRQRPRHVAGPFQDGEVKKTNLTHSRA
jgi:hypothetical protein